MVPVLTGEHSPGTVKMNKEICKRCREDSYDCWNHVDDGRWEKEKWVLCYGKDDVPRGVRTEDAPCFCRYALEQIVLEQEVPHA